MGRILVTPRDILGNKLRLHGPAARHILQVLRKKPGDIVEVTDGEGRHYAVRLESSLKNELTGEIVSVHGEPEDPRAKPRLFQAIPKSQRMDWIIEKAVELGAGAIHPLWTQRSVVVPHSHEWGGKLERWRRIAGEALGQSQGSVLCPVHAPCSLEDSLSQIQPSELTLVAWEEETAHPLKEALRERTNQPLNIFIGPEGGLAPEEIARLRGRGAQTVSLGKRVLRVETAAVMFLSSILYESLL